jgi:hypothetical protein
MKKMASSSVLVYGMGGVGIEIGNDFHRNLSEKKKSNKNKCTAFLDSMHIPTYL